MLTIFTIALFQVATLFSTPSAHSSSNTPATHPYKCTTAEASKFNKGQSDNVLNNRFAFGGTTGWNGDIAALGGTTGWNGDIAALGGTTGWNGDIATLGGTTGWNGDIVAFGGTTGWNGDIA